MIYDRLNDVLTGKEDNYMLPFYWQHGDHTASIPEEVERIYQSGARAFCVESRPHRDFCGEGWWRDMDIILAEAEKRGMKVWILDDDHFPTGHAAGKIKEHPELRNWQLAERHVDVMGPLDDALLIAEKTDGDHRLLDVWACRRVPSSESRILEDCADDCIRLTDGVKDGFLRFSIPAGCWRVFFFYKTRRGTSHPDYIDMISEESVRVLIDAVYEPHFARYGRYFGNTLAGFFSDEPSFGNNWSGAHSVDRGMYDRRVGMPGLALPWNDRIPGMMEKALGFDPAPYLSALWFGLGGEELTGRIRHAYMDAVTKLYRDCFTRQLGDWCEAHGVMYIGHIIEDMNAHARLGCSGGHYFRSLDGQHMSGIDIVLHQIMPGMSDYIHTCTASGNNADPAFFDYVLAKLASSFAHIGTQTEGRAMCEVFGAYGWAEGGPAMKWLLDYLLVRGVNRFVPHAFSPAFPDPDCPPHFGANGHDPQFGAFSALMTYGNRAAHLLSGGVHRADCAILYHADAEWMNKDGDAMLTEVPAKTLYDAHIDFDILPADCFTGTGGSRVFPAGAENGVLKVGPERYQCLVVPAAAILPAELEAALGKLEEQGVPVIRMKKDTAPEDLLAALGGFLKRDIEVEADFPKLRICHYTAGSSEIYMFVNESVADPVKTSVKLSGLEEVREGVWLDLLHGEEVRVPMENGRLSIELAPYQSAVAVFERTGEIPALPAKKRWTRSEPADLTFRIEKALWTDLSSYEPVADKVSPDALFSLTAADRDPGFSGRIRYTARFDTNQFEGKRESLALDLGEVGQTARLILNGKDLGERVCPPFRYDLTEALRDGENELVIEVSNTLANAVRDNFSMFMAIPASGLIGPVSWLREE
ncbi:MAG: glycosyl transferase family 2 [Clostridia bacterium]|nr:glycosyl transferase family 2 [Clostridia bacterium]